MKQITYILFVILLLSLMSCKVERYLQNEEQYLRKVEMLSDDDNEIVHQLSLIDYIKQHPKTDFLGTRIFTQHPTIYDSLKTLATIRDITYVLHNNGFLKAKINASTKALKKSAVDVVYTIHLGPQYNIHTIQRCIKDENIRTLICGTDTLSTLLHERAPFNLNTLAEERSRITKQLRSNGYYKFNKDYITFDADTLEDNNNIDLTMNIALHKENSKAEEQPHTQYVIGDINYIINNDTVTTSSSHSNSPFRVKLLTSNTLFRTGTLYNEQDEKDTYNFMNRLSAIGHSYIRFNERPETNLLDIDIHLQTLKSKTLSLDLEGTNPAGDLGAAASISLLHNNLFRSSEAFTIKLRGAYESISGLEGYEGNSYVELGGELNLSLPGTTLPFISKEFSITHLATSEFSTQYNLQDRPEFNRRVFTAAWRYKWTSKNRKLQHRLDILELNYVRMPWISNTFKEHYLDSIGRTNAILKYNYEDQLITKLGYTFTYNSLGNAQNTYGKDALVLKANIETSGNVLSLVSPLFDNTHNSIGQKMFLGIAYSQYAKGDAEITKSFMFNKNNSLALHAAFGIAYPYGNSTMLPFEKRYFAGGANNVRGWSVRSLGPGKYNGADKDINFINQSGDMKLYLSAEMRSFLFWKLSGALFVDAGNIWTLRDYEDQPNGLFRLNTLLETIAVSYGVGLRFNFDFFILRFDAGMKAINPAYEGKEHFPIIHHNLKDDFAFHFAVGLPF